MVQPKEASRTLYISTPNFKLCNKTSNFSLVLILKRFILIVVLFLHSNSILTYFLKFQIFFKMLYLVLVPLYQYFSVFWVRPYLIWYLNSSYLWLSGSSDINFNIFNIDNDFSILKILFNNLPNGFFTTL